MFEAGFNAHPQSRSAQRAMPWRAILGSILYHPFDFFLKKAKISISSSSLAKDPAIVDFLLAAAFQPMRTEPPRSRGGEISHCHHLHRQDHCGLRVGGFHPSFSPGSRSQWDPRRRHGSDGGFARVLCRLQRSGS